ncbi:MAG: hypothetical protein K0S48_3979 [Ramlibacter sp.]|nr:hypothetical protein [Ramlibacter sp.]
MHRPCTSVWKMPTGQDSESSRNICSLDECSVRCAACRSSSDCITALASSSSTSFCPGSRAGRGTASITHSMPMTWPSGVRRGAAAWNTMPGAPVTQGLRATRASRRASGISA